MPRSYFFRAVSAFAFTVLTISLSSQAVRADVKLGLLLPKSGVYAALGNEIDDGFVYGLETGGVILDVEIIREDSEAKPAVGLAKARKLVYQDQVSAIVGLVSSAVLGAVRNFVHQNETPLIVANAGNDRATGDQCSRYITRVSFSNGQINRPMGPWMFDRGIQKVYTLAPDYAAGRQMIDAFTLTYTKAGGEIVGGDFTPFARTQDFGPYLTKARASGADALYVFYAGGEAIRFVKQYGSFGLAQTLPLYGSGFLTSSLYVKAEGRAADGIVTALHYSPDLDSPANRAFVEGFRNRFGRKPSEFAVQGYDAGRLIAKALAHGADDRTKLAEILPQLNYSSPRGPLRIDPKTNNVIQNIYIYETGIAADGMATQKILATVPGVRDPESGCMM